MHSEHQVRRMLRHLMLAEIFPVKRLTMREALMVIAHGAWRQLLFVVLGPVLIPWHLARRELEAHRLAPWHIFPLVTALCLVFLWPILRAARIWSNWSGRRINKLERSIYFGKWSEDVDRENTSLHEKLAEKDRVIKRQREYIHRLRKGGRNG